MKRAASASDKRHLSRLAEMPCCLCTFLRLGDTPSEIHHVRVNVGWGRDGHKNAISLCPEHHRGDTGVHAMGRQQFTDMYGISELDLLARVNEELGVLA